MICGTRRDLLNTCVVCLSVKFSEAPAGLLTRNLFARSNRTLARASVIIFVCLSSSAIRTFSLGVGLGVLFSACLDLYWLELKRDFRLEHILRGLFLLVVPPSELALKFTLLIALFSGEIWDLLKLLAAELTELFCPFLVVIGCLNVVVLWNAISGSCELFFSVFASGVVILAGPYPFVIDFFPVFMRTCPSSFWLLSLLSDRNIPNLIRLPGKNTHMLVLN